MSTKDEILEHVRTLLHHKPFGEAPADWVDDPELDRLDDHDDRQACEDVLFAHGFLLGAAAMADMTVLELLDQSDIDVAIIACKCPTCGGGVHQCKTGDHGCLHCDDEHCGGRVYLGGMPK